jgi:hypothetical protein
VSAKVSEEAEAEVLAAEPVAVAGDGAEAAEASQPAGV